jgi:drug/metabolite transporter (DMT)-like permease
MFDYVWPLAVVVLSNVFYQICAKSIPEGMSPLASLTITYAIGTLSSLILYYILNKDANIFHEYSKVNWAPFILGLVIIGLEVGYIYAYKAGWPVSTAQIVQATVLAVILIFVGYFLYKESLTWNKIVGIIVCLVGLGLINFDHMLIR